MNDSSELPVLESSAAGDDSKSFFDGDPMAALSTTTGVAITSLGWSLALQTPIEHSMGLLVEESMLVDPLMAHAREVGVSPPARMAKKFKTH